MSEKSYTQCSCQAIQRSLIVNKSLFIGALRIVANELIINFRSAANELTINFRSAANEQVHNHQVQKCR